MYHLDDIVVIQGVGEGEEKLLVKGVISQMFQGIWNGNAPLFGASVHGGAGAEKFDYRIQVIIRRLISSDAQYLAMCSDQI